MGGNTTLATTRGAGGTHTEEEEAATRKKEKNQERELEMFVSILCVYTLNIVYAARKLLLLYRRAMGASNPWHKAPLLLAMAFHLADPLQQPAKECCSVLCLPLMRIDQCCTTILTNTPKSPTP